MGTKSRLVAFISAGLFLLCQGSSAYAIQDAFLKFGVSNPTTGHLRFTLDGESGVPYTIEASNDLGAWAPIVTNSDAGFLRIIDVEVTNSAGFYRVTRRGLPMFAGALVARHGITFSTNSILIDSFNSMDPNYSTQGCYDPAKAKAGADICSDKGLIDLGNAVVKGKLRMGLEAGCSLGPAGSIGDLVWGGPGIQVGWSSRDFRFFLPEAPPPYATGLTPIGGTLAGTNYLWVLGSGDYLYADPNGVKLTNGAVILVIGSRSRLYVAADFVMEPGTSILITAGAILELYVGGSNTVLGQVHNRGNCYQFRYFGLPANTNVTVLSTGSLAGMLYAPNAAVTLNAAEGVDIQGTVTADSIVVNSQANFHFDENLIRKGLLR